MEFNRWYLPCNIHIYIYWTFSNNCLWKNISKKSLFVVPCLTPVPVHCTGQVEQKFQKIALFCIRLWNTTLESCQIYLRKLWFTTWRPARQLKYVFFLWRQIECGRKDLSSSHTVLEPCQLLFFILLFSYEIMSFRKFFHENSDYSMLLRLLKKLSSYIILSTFINKGFLCLFKLESLGIYL